jgi:hypothetical protein
MPLAVREVMLHGNGDMPMPSEQRIRVEARISLLLGQGENQIYACIDCQSAATALNE